MKDGISQISQIEGDEVLRFRYAVLFSRELLLRQLLKNKTNQTVKTIIGRCLAYKTVQAYLGGEALDDERGLISRSLCKIFIVSPL